MLVVNTELWPFGEEAERRALGTLVICSVRGGNRSDYVYVQLDSRDEVIDQGAVLSHLRSDGWARLVARALKGGDAVPVPYPVDVPERAMQIRDQYVAAARAAERRT